MASQAQKDDPPPSTDVWASKSSQELTIDLEWNSYKRCNNKCDDESLGFKSLNLYSKL